MAVFDVALTVSTLYLVQVRLVLLIQGNKAERLCKCNYASNVLKTNCNVYTGIKVKLLF